MRAGAHRGAMAGVGLIEVLIALVIIAGGVLAGAYVFRVLGRMLAAPEVGAEFRTVAHGRQLLALALAAAAVLMGLLPLAPMGFLEIGRFM